MEPKPNRNGVSRLLAVAAAKAGLKTIVFMNNTAWANKSARETGDALEINVDYTSHEARLFGAIEAEFGDPACSILHNLKRCVPHHADLIPHERQLAESLYRREDGARIIFATTTLSQGMNLPAQVAILSADERAALGGEYVTQEPMKAHELLNAAGRAGRAGYLANGLVILVPRALLTFTENGPEENAHTVLQSIIPEDERCVQMIDPLGKVLDRVQQGVVNDMDVEYLFNRLGDSRQIDEVTSLFKRSLAYYRANTRQEKESLEAGIAAFARKLTDGAPEVLPPIWLMELSIQSGISAGILSRLYQALGDNFEALPTTVPAWVNWMLGWLSIHDDAGKFCFGADLSPLQKIGGVQQVTPENYAATFINLKKGMTAWLGGEPLKEVEKAMGGTLNNQRIICPRARELATNTAPRCLSYFSTFIIQIVKHIAEEKQILLAQPAILECLQSAISKGVDSPQMLAFMHLTSGRYRSRVEAHKDYRQRFRDLEVPDGLDYLALVKFVAELLNTP